MAKPRRIKPAGYDDRLPLTEHLDELRSRLILCALVLAGAIALCFWQNHAILEIANSPLPKDFEPITLSPTEPFMTTLTVVAYAAILITLPFLLYQAYAFVLPALKPTERKTLTPILFMVPILFICGVIFAYFVVVPAAVKFLLNFNSDNFNIQVRAKDYYSFLGMTLVSLGGVFQIPVAILAVTKLGIVTPQQLSKNRRYAILACAVIAMVLPGTDPITMLACMAPLVILFELSLLLSRWIGMPAEPKSESDSDEPVSGAAPSGA